MSSVVAQIAEAVVTELNTNLLAPPTVAVRSWLPRAELKDLVAVKVTVAPRALIRRRRSRSEVGCEAGIDVAVQQQVGASSEATIDSLVELAEAIATHLDGWVCDSPAAICVAVEHRPLVALDHLEEHHVLTSLIGLTFWL